MVSRRRGAHHNISQFRRRIGSLLLTSGRSHARAHIRVVDKREHELRELF